MKRDSQKILRAWRLVYWNALLLGTGIFLIAIVGEVQLRLTVPFMTGNRPKTFVPNVGLLLKPNEAIRHTNGVDFWTVARTNSLGFLDREPMNPKCTAGSCHVTAIGDSFVEALEVPISDKFQVQMEKIAAYELPHLSITTSAFGRSGTGQINQLPYYDEFARSLRPRLLILVFVRNDFADNSPLFSGFHLGVHPDRIPYVSARREPDGTVTLHPPDPEYRAHRLPRSLLPKAWDMLVAAKRWSADVSFFASWLDNRLDRSLLDGWLLMERRDPYSPFLEKDIPPSFEDLLGFTAFGLQQFKKRADRDGISLVILAAHNMGTRGDPAFDRMNEIAKALKIPVIDQYDYVVRQGDKIEGITFPRDGHWNATGHRRAAEAILEYLEQNQHICDYPLEQAQRIQSDRQPTPARWGVP